MRVLLQVATTLVLAVTTVRADELEQALDEVRVGALIGALKGSGQYERWEGAHGLAGLGGVGLPALCRGLDSEDTDTRIRCAYALRDVAPPPVAAVPRLVRMLQETEDANERDTVAETLVALADQENVVYYASAATGNREMPAHLAYLALARIGPGQATTPMMIEGLGSSDATIRSIAVHVLAPKDWWSMRDRERLLDRVLDPVAWPSFWNEARFSEDRTAVLARLAPLLRDADARTRALAANGLGRAERPLPAGDVQALERALVDPDEDVGSRAAQSLARLAERGLAPRDVLLSMLRSGSSVQQAFAARAVFRMGSNAQWAVRDLQQAWSKPGSLDAREAAAAALGRLGAGTDEMVGQLAAAYGDIDPWDELLTTVARRAELTEWLRANEAAYPVLLAAATGERRIKVVNDRYDRLKPEDAVRALEVFPERREELVPVLQRLFDDFMNLFVRLRSAETLLRLGAPKETYERQLGRLVDATCGYWLVVTTELLLRADPGSQRAVSRLLRALRENIEIRGGQPHEMARLLVAIGRLPPSAKAPLLAAARGDNWDLRREAVRALGHLGDPDAEVRDFLWSLLDDDSDCGPAAAEALALCVDSPEDIERLITMAPRNGGRSLAPLGADPRKADVACRTLALWTKEGKDLRFVVEAIDGIAPRSEIAAEARLGLLRSGKCSWQDMLWFYRGQGDPRFVPSLVRQLPRFSGFREGRQIWQEVFRKVARPEDLARVAGVMEEMLHLPDSRADALLALGAIGAHAAPAVPAIRELQSDPALRSLARETLEQILR